MNSNKILVAVIGLQCLTLATQWLGQPAIVSPAEAQIPDAGGQRAQMIEQLTAVNTNLKSVNAELKVHSAKLEKLNELLDSGRLQVRLSSPDENKRSAGK